MKTAVFLLIALACWPAGGAEPSMSGPTEAEPREYVRLEITDLPVESLAQAVLIVWPEPGTELLPIRTWGGEPLMLFRAVRPGEYLVQVVVPVLDGKIAKLLQVRHVITVRGPPIPPAPPIPPPLPPGPDPPVPPPTPETSGVAYLIAMRPDQPTEAQAANLMLLRQWADSQPPDKAEMLELTKDQRDSSGGADRRVAGYVALIPPGEQLPYVFLIQSKTDGSGNYTHWKGQLDGNHNAIIDRIKGVMP